MSDAIAGTVIAGRYELIHPLGRGTFGHMVLAYDREQQRSVALKVLDRGDHVDLKALEMFEREAAVLRSIRHQGIPAMYDVVRDEWFGAIATILVMEYIEGVSLGAMIDAQEQREPTDIVHYFLELLGVLEHLHSRVPPVIHRDIKPANIIVRANGQPVLVDFGAVRRVHMNADEAGSTIVGTYGYMPYEQYMGQATPASDLYALAATFLHLMTGRPPRDFMTDEGRIAVPDALPGDARLQPIIARLLRPSPQERFASAREVRNALLSSTTTAVVASSRRSVIARGSIELATIGPAPRQIAGDIKTLLDRAAPSALELMDSNAKPGDVPGISDWLSLAFFSTLTLGVLPMVFISIARARRRRLRRFLEQGMPAVAVILEIGVDTQAFDNKMSKVTYEFEVDGELHRDADQIMPAIANRWQVGDRVQVLFIEALDYDSVILSVR